MTELPQRPCPICGKVAAPRFRPFCSARCADVDLGHWLSGDYAIPVPADGEEDDVPEMPGHERKAWYKPA